MAGNSTGLPIRADLASIARKRGLLAPTGETNVLIVPWVLYHRRDIPVGGTTNLTFFNEGKAPGITNVDNPNQFPANQIFEVHGMRFGFLPGINRLGQRLGIAAPDATQLNASTLSRSATLTTADPATLLPLYVEKTRELLTQGAGQLQINSRVVHDFYGLHTFPESKGVCNDQQVAMTGTFTAGAGLSQIRGNIFNGAPVANNQRLFPTKLAIFGGQQFSLNVTWQQAVAFDQATVGPLNGIAGAVTAGTLTAELFGVLILPVS